MNPKERSDLLLALIAASNAFHNALKKRGYDVSYGLSDPHEGHIYKLNEKSEAVGWPLGKISVRWKLEKEDATC